MIANEEGWAKWKRRRANSSGTEAGRRREDEGGQRIQESNAWTGPNYRTAY